MKLGIFLKLLSDGMRPRLVISSDAGPFDCEFGRMHCGMELGVQGGMSPRQAIEASTRVAAEACGVAHLVGCIEAGKEADLLIVRGDPLAEIGRMVGRCGLLRRAIRRAPARGSLLLGVTR